MPKFAVDQKKVFLAAFRRIGNITLAAQAANIDRILHYRWMREDPNYPQMFADAQDEAVEVLEAEAVRRGVYGWEEEVTWQGHISYHYQRNPKTGKNEKVPVTVRRYDGALLQFLLRGARPQKYRERYVPGINQNLNVRFAGTMDQLLALYHQLTTEVQPAVIDVEPQRTLDQGNGHAGA